jgi:hypothetical protein
MMVFCRSLVGRVEKVRSEALEATLQHLQYKFYAACRLAHKPFGLVDVFPLPHVGVIRQVWPDRFLRTADQSSGTDGIGLSGAIRTVAQECYVRSYAPPATPMRH